MPARSWVRPPGRPHRTDPTHPGFDDARWVTATGHVGRLLLAADPGEDASRVAAWSLALGSGIRIDLEDVVSASPLAWAWIDGFLAGRAGQAMAPSASARGASTAGV